MVVFTIHRHESRQSQWKECTAWEKPESEVRQPYTLGQLRSGSQGWRRGGRAYTWQVCVCGGFWGAGRVRRVGVKTILNSQRRGVSEAEELQALGRSSGEQDLSPRGRGNYKEATSNPKQNQSKKPENSVLD